MREPQRTLDSSTSFALPPFPDSWLVEIQFPTLGCVAAVAGRSDVVDLIRAALTDRDDVIPRQIAFRRVVLVYAAVGTAEAVPDLLELPFAVAVAPFDPILVPLFGRHVDDNLNIIVVILPLRHRRPAARFRC